MQKLEQIQKLLRTGVMFNSSFVLLILVITDQTRRALNHRFWQIIVDVCLVKTFGTFVYAAVVGEYASSYILP